MRRSISHTEVSIDSDEGLATIDIWHIGGDTQQPEKIELSFRSENIAHDHRFPFTYAHPNSENTLKYTLRIMDNLKTAYIYPMFGEYVIHRGEVPLTVKGNYEYFNQHPEDL